MGRPRKNPTFYNPTDEGEQVSDGQADGEPSRIEAVKSQAVDVAESVSADVSLSPNASAVSDARQAQIDAERIRAKRKPFGAYTQKLAHPPRVGYQRHWFNDVAGRIDDAKESGWAHVHLPDGKPLKRVVGTGRDQGVLNAYLMELPKVLWQEDQDAKHKLAQDKIDGIRKSPFRAKAGEAKASDQGKFYSPKEDTDPLQIVKT